MEVAIPYEPKKRELGTMASVLHGKLFDLSQ